ncbi:MAG: type IV pilus secretin PilQ [Deltaproteobacteria bacterium]|nr:type IV pilus secretin PilQ [Deltaproteobacteria bacterium]
MATLLFCVVENVQASTEIVTVTSVIVEQQSVVFKTDAKQLVFKSYTLGAPARLVVDVENALPDFTDRKFTINDGFKSLRIGLYADKTRFVFDALNDVLPDARVEQVDGKLIIAWGVQDKVFTAPVVPGTPNAVEQIDFDARNGQSVFTVSLSSQAELISPTVEDDVIRFGVKDTVIPRSLRRVVDASVFPSAVLQITPYSTIIAGERSVMFAARMKGPVDYTVNLVGSSLVFRTTDGPFAEIPAEKISSVVIPVEVGAMSEIVSDGDDVAQMIESFSSQSPNYDVRVDYSNNTDAPKVYTGEPVDLVFDDADIRTVMQLIAEVSDQNLILSDGVTGNITLRLHEVPWDQALDLILEIKELGTINQGNVIRVLPLKQIEESKAARLVAQKEIVELQSTETQVFDVNFRDVDVIADAIEGMLTDDGEIRAINGSKKIMVNDVPTKLIEVQALIDELDIAEKQVMIEARLVEVERTEGMSLGVKWGVSYSDNNSGGIDDLSKFDTGGGGSFLISPSTVSSSSAAGIGTAMTFGILGVDSTVLDLRLSALEESGKGKIVSTPKVMALNGETATISQGEEIPYQVVDDEGEATIEFKDAKLTLDVTPQINSDGSIILKIDATNSARGEQVPTGELAINTKEAHTTLMINDGETTVIGGIIIDFEKSETDGVPFLMDIPYLGNLFKSKVSSGKQTEFLIFLTPHIVDL